MSHFTTQTTTFQWRDDDEDDDDDDDDNDDDDDIDDNYNNPQIVLKSNKSLKAEFMSPASPTIGRLKPPGRHCSRNTTFYWYM